MANIVKKAMDKVWNPDTKHELKTTNKPVYSTTETHQACTWQGAKKVSVEKRPKPMITESQDAIVRITATTVCGSDLHLYADVVPAVAPNLKGDILGHEAVGFVESVGPDVTIVKPGDRVVISAVISCGTCFYCKRGEFSCCDFTNPSGQMENLYGHRCAALFGYSHLTGAYDGLQAEYARVPFANVNLLPVPQDARLTDDQLIVLSDIACTGWHGNELGEVSQGQTVAVWGAGPVGLMAAMWARFRGASRVFVIDNDEFRLNFAKTKIGAEVLNFDKDKEIGKKLLEIIPEGLDVCIDCAGYRFPSTVLHKIETALKIESDSLDIIDQMSYATRKRGHIVLIGDYFGYGNHFPIGRVMEKGLTMRGGQLFAQKYWKTLLGFILEGKVDPSVVITHHMPFEKIGEAYKMFFEHEDNCIKIVLSVQSTK